MSNFYLISFDKEKVDSSKLHQVISKSSLILNWWHYLGSAYIIKTNANLAGIQTELLSKWPSNSYLIIKVDPAHRTGWLVPDAWNWFKRNVDQ